MTTLAEMATEALRWKILRGELTDSDGLTERALCEQLQMSRTPVRIALQTLVGEGLLAYEAQRGHRIRPSSPDLISDAYEVRAVLEGLACRLLATRGCPADVLRELESCVAQGDTLLRSRELSFHHGQWRTMNQRFHNLILEAVANVPLISAVRQAERIPMTSLSVIATMGSQPNWRMLEGAQRDHERIACTLAAQQSVRAEALMREHIYFARDLIVAQIAERPAGTTDNGSGN